MHSTALLKQLEATAEANDYTHITVLPDGAICCVARFIYTYAILADLTYWGYEDRWCYHTHEAAYKALLRWIETAGEGEPTGWHRHPRTGRRVYKDFCEVRH